MGACEVIGRPREELIGKSDYDLFPKEQADKFWKKDNLVFETGETNVSEEEVTWRGKVHTISTKKSLFTDSMTGKRFIVGTARDITEQKRAEEALRRSEKRFREIFENTAVGMYRTTPDGRILMANPALVHMMEYSSFEELSQRNLEEEGFEPQYGRSIFKEEIERKGRIVSLESTWITRDGKKLYVIENARAVQDEDGKILYYEGTAENITERKKAEKQLKQSREFLSNAINALDDPFFAKDEEHRWAVLNDAACEVMGRPREELIGKSDYDLFSKEQADVFWERDNLVLKNGVTDVNEEEITWHGKLHTISTKKSVYTDSL
ncbi:MAG: PAS domain-containing protein, partial [Planctomycetota bacterium]